MERHLGSRAPLDGCDELVEGDADADADRVALAWELLPGYSLRVMHLARANTETAATGEPAPARRSRADSASRGRRRTDVVIAADRARMDLEGVVRKR